MISRVLSLLILTAGVSAEPTSQPDGIAAAPISPSTQPAASAPASNGQTERFSPADLIAALDDYPEMFRVSRTQAAEFKHALDSVNFGALIQRLTPFLREHFADRWNAEADAIMVPVPADKQVELQSPSPGGPAYRGPRQETIGFLVHDLTPAEYVKIAVRLMQTARVMLDTGDPLFNRNSSQYHRLRAEQEAGNLADAARRADEEAHRREYMRRRVGEMLGVYDRATGQFKGTPKWVTETRRFMYSVRGGRFIERLEPLVTRMNEEIRLAGFPGPSTIETPGIRVDQQLGDVEIVLPQSMMDEFLTEAARLERRMAADQMISIEAVRLDDQDLLEGAIGARLKASFQGVHDYSNDRDRGQGLTDWGINSLVAVANRQLQVASLGGAAPELPAGTTPVLLPALSRPLTSAVQRGTNMGTSFSIGAEDRYFSNFNPQSIGFSYIGPDGLNHTISLEAVDTLQELWIRIERNLVVHQVTRNSEPTKFSVPVGPDQKTFLGIAALISQENQEQVVASQNTLTKLSATAGSWLIIRDFSVVPVPGSSTTLTPEEQRVLNSKVLLTMFLRDSTVPVEAKLKLVEAHSLDALDQALGDIYAERKDTTVLTMGAFRTYEDIFEGRIRDASEDADVEKKERNSRIRLSFYSSQGRINGNLLLVNNALGDTNDLTSFETQLSPNAVTPISSTAVRTSTSMEGKSLLTNLPRGKAEEQEKNMSHLFLRVNLPTIARGRADREEGSYQGYFQLPFGRKPLSSVDVPFLSSADHPLTRLSKLATGALFPSLQADRVRHPFDMMTVERGEGTVTGRVHEMCMRRILLMRKLIADSHAIPASEIPRYRLRFDIEIRSLLEYDDDFFPVANVALRNMAHWNNTDRILTALAYGPDRFSLDSLKQMIDELGAKLLPDEYLMQNVGRLQSRFLAGHRLYPLTTDEVRAVRRDAANHYMRFMEFYGDAFMEAVSATVGLGSYRTSGDYVLAASPLDNYQDIVLFDNGARAHGNSELFEEAHGQFVSLLEGGRGEQTGPRGKSPRYLEQMDTSSRAFVLRGADLSRRYREFSNPPGQEK